MQLPVSSASGRPWYADGLRFTCTQCGNCCTGGPGYVWISREEIGRLATHLGLSLRETLRRYCRRIGVRYSLKETRTTTGLYDCVFLKSVPAEDPGGGASPRMRRVCSIYPVRPLQCRTWPFWDGNLADEAGWRRSSQKCPGMGSGRAYTFERIEALRTAKDWPDDAPTSE